MVDPEVLGIQLMRGIKHIALVICALLPCTSAAQNESTVCTGRPITSRDGTAAVLTDCDLETIWARAGMRAHLLQCEIGRAHV